MKYFLFFGLFSALLLFNSCKKYQAAPAAFFINSNTVNVVTTGTAQGTSSNKITDLYLYVNGQFQGAYPVGHTLPIVTRDSRVKVDVFAGIKNNGIKSLSITWPFYDKVEFDTLVASGKTIDRSFSFRYASGVTFAWLEDFEGNGFSLVKSLDNGGAADAVFTVAPAPDTFEGNRSMELSLPGSVICGVLESSLAYALPKGNSNVYLELNYKCDAPFEVGVVTTDGTSKSTLNVNPQSNWNKIYIQLADAVNRQPSTDLHKVYFRLLKTNDYPDPHVWLDNIKLIYL